MFPKIDRLNRQQLALYVAGGAASAYVAAKAIRYVASALLPE